VRGKNVRNRDAANPVFHGHENTQRTSCATRPAELGDTKIQPELPSRQDQPKVRTRDMKSIFNITENIICFLHKKSVNFRHSCSGATGISCVRSAKLQKPIRRTASCQSNLQPRCLPWHSVWPHVQNRQSPNRWSWRFRRNSLCRNTENTDNKITARGRIFPAPDWLSGSHPGLSMGLWGAP
jgi:hypothetical protein